MFSILISEKGGETKRMEFDRPEITIGRVAGNDIVLPRNNISKRHSRIVFKDGKFIVVDLKSTNGTFVNGRKITGPLVVKGSDKIYVGDFIVTIEEGTGASTSSTADLENAGASDGAARPAPPPPPRGTRPMPPIPLRAEPTSMDMPSGDAMSDADKGDAPAAPAAPPPAASPSSRPPVPPLSVRPSIKPPALDDSPVRPTVSNEAIRDEKVQRLFGDKPGLSPLDRPIVPQDRISDKATMMGGDAPSPKLTPPPVTSSASADTPVPASSAPSASSSPSAAAPPVAAAPPPVSSPPVSAPPSSALRPALSRPSSGGSASPLGAVRPLPRPSAAPVTARPAAPPSIASDDPQRRRHFESLSQVVNKALDQLSLQHASPEQLQDASSRLERVVKEHAEKVFPLPIGLDSEGLAKQAMAELVGAGPLDELLNDETVFEVAVAGHDRIFVDRGTGQSLSERLFTSPAAVQRAVHRLVSKVAGKTDQTLLEVRLENGVLLQAALPPLARVPSLVLKRVRKSGGRLQDLVSQNVLSAAMSEFLEVCMRERRNLIVSGYGRLVMLGALGGATAAGARVITVEPVSELDLSGTNSAWIGLFARGPEMRQVIGQAVRMHPDHLLITDVRGPEAFEVAACLAGGQGVVVGVDAASAREALGRIESLARLSGESPSRKALREELANAVNLAVHVGRTAAGAYRVMEISEVTLAEEGGIDLIPIFTFKPEGGDGQFVATGHVPAFAG